MNLSFFALTLACLAAPVSAGFLETQRGSIVPMPMYSFPRDCGAESKLSVISSTAALLQQDLQNSAKSANVPGAGLYKEKDIKPFEKVLKDGFLMVDCAKDYMYYRGDKYGDNKHDYKLGPVSSVSIVHYNAFVARKDRVKMTPTVCFEFCRTVPNMGFFGITNGRSCYCTPYFTPMESDSSQCDAVCEGEGSEVCGGKTKSTMFAMHMCGSTVDDLNDRGDKARQLSADMNIKVKTAKEFVVEMEATANDMMPLFSKVGDSAASDLAQKAKEMSSGILLHKAEETGKIRAKLVSQADTARTLANSPTLETSETMTRAEHLIENMDDTVAAAEESTDKLDEMMEYVSPPPRMFESASALRNYYPVMYFIDDKFDLPVPTTCTGDLVGLPVVGKDTEDCARACDDNLVKGCVGFQHFDNKNYATRKVDGVITPGKMCFLFSKFTTGFYYTGCKKETQKTTGCYAKFNKFAGGKFGGSGTLKPGGVAGKPFCKECFKSFTKADRCYTEE